MGLSTTDGFSFWPGRLSAAAQSSLLDQVLAGIEAAPLYRPITPGGKPMSVRMTNFGALGWITDAAGYRYEPTHPVTGQAWPAIPDMLLDLWANLADSTTPPDACLVNLYEGEARMSLHQDRDEADFGFPVLSVSLGDTAVFRLGGLARKDPSGSLRLASGDVCQLAGAARLCHHLARGRANQPHPAPRRPRLMAEDAHTGEDHGHAALVGRLDHLLVANGATGLDHRCAAGVGGLDQAVREREEGLRGAG
jgi:DNA oxidative demethylase